MTVKPTVAGLREIAEALGVAHQTVKGWRARGLLDHLQLPGTVSGAPAYSLAAVRDWYETSPPKPGRPKGGSMDPLGLTRCASCDNAFETDRQADGTCAHCGGRFDPQG